MDSCPSGNTGERRIIMYDNINLSALEGALKEAINNHMPEVDYDVPIAAYDTAYVADILASVLGIEAEENEFCWQAKILCDFHTSIFKMGLSEISITKGKASIQL